MKGRLEYECQPGDWWVSAYEHELQEFLEAMLLRPVSRMTYRWREGSRAVILWPEERMGEVMEILE